MRGSPETLELARRLAKSKNHRKRALGLHIAAQLHRRQKGIGFMGFYASQDVQKILLTGLDDTCPEVLRAAISGAGHQPFSLALPYLIKFASHPDQHVRFSVAVALGSYSTADSIEALLRLATDESDLVRDWATFGIGTQQKADSPKIRDLLWANLKDKDDEVRGEALVGLAIRKDQRIIPVLLETLDANCRGYELKAAEAIGSPLLLMRLNAMKDAVDNENATDSYWYQCLLDAIEASSEK